MLFDQRSFWGHSSVLFSLNLSVEPSFSGPQGDSSQFGQVVKIKFIVSPNRNVDTTDELESKVGALEKAFKMAITVSGPA